MNSVHTNKETKKQRHITERERVGIRQISLNDTIHTISIVPEIIINNNNDQTTTTTTTTTTTPTTTTTTQQHQYNVIVR